MDHSNLRPETQDFLRDLWAKAGEREREPQGCTATYDHFAHDDCPGTITREEYEAKTAHIDYDDVAYLEFYHEVYIFDNEVYRIEAGEDGIASIRYDTSIITHEDGRTMEIPHACVQTWMHKE